jgi:hypothetical protein
MSEKFDLMDKNVRFYMDGGWEFLGKVVFLDLEKIIITNFDEENIVIYREKISAAKIVDEINLEDEVDAVMNTGYHNVMSPAVHPALYNETNNFGAFIPEDMLKEDKNKKKSPQVDFSISLQQLKSIEKKI